MKQAVQGWSSRMIALVVATLMAATTLLVGPVMAGPSLAAKGVDIPSVSAEAFQGWGAVCKRERIRVASGTGWVRYANKEYRWWTDSLTGTTCRLWDVSYVTIRYS